jgi:hypothetical protein
MTETGIPAMTFEQVANALQLGEEQEVWKPDFSRSSEFAESVRRWIFSEGEPWKDGRRIGFPIESAEAVHRAVKAFRRRPEAVRLLAHLHYLLFQKGEASEFSIHLLPMLPDSAAEWGDMIYAFALLTGLPKTLEIHRRRGIPENVTLHTLSDIGISLRKFYERTGRWGTHAIGWLHQHFQGRLIRLGRLQFQLGRYDGPFKVFEHIQDKRYVVLALPGLWFRNDGQFADADDETAPPPACWPSSFVEEADRVTGHPVSAETGAVSHDTVTLDRRVWKIALQKGDAVLPIHIPADGPLDVAECLASINNALPFFERHFPERSPFRAMLCTSWLMDPQFRRHLKTANITRFQALFHPLPVPGANDAQMFERAFQNQRNVPDKLPNDTSLRRALISGMKNGIRWRRGGGVILRSQLPLDGF